jgi:hypothetical protein
LYLQPISEFASVASSRGVERCELVVADPVQVCAAIQKIFGSRALSSVASTPESISNLALIWRGLAGEELF